MLKLDKNKLAGLKTFDDHLQERYGAENSPVRKEFEAKAKAWYYAELLKNERKRQNVTQKVLAEKIGKKRVHIFTRKGSDRYATLYVLAHYRCSWPTLFFGVGIDWILMFSVKVLKCNFFE